MMQQLKKGWSELREFKQSFDYRFDKMLVDNVIPFWTQAKFYFKQKVTYNRTHTRAFTLFKLFMFGYLTTNIFGLPLDQCPDDGAGQLIFTEYQILANHVERDHYEELGREQNLKRLFEKGKRKGLSQVELFELSKYMELHYLAKEILPHLEYLQNLKAPSDN